VRGRRADPVGLIALALCPVILRESRETTATRSYDPAGALSITGALVLVVYALVTAPDAGWGSPQTILLVAGAAALLAIFAMIESRHRAPLVPLRILALAHARRRERRDAPLRHRRVRHAVHRHALRPSRCSAPRPSSSAPASW
jgi:hypothetical protein